jgi:diaminohydroxyphosphoribosylaminopyrimidine deaminase / 5-amino-6-(5-phosphoribosylamino)uracil reductase
MSPADELYMRRAFELSLRGAGQVSPNPLVGCVIVRDGVVIGEGWHQKYGGPHAEVNAVRSVVGQTVEGAIVYVTLEPCSHFGKTPPCADLLVKEKVSSVVIANGDPNPLVQGRGIEKLRSGGISVNEGVLTEFGRKLNRRFFCFMEKKRPYVILKWAQTSDGFIARKNFDSKWISNGYSRQLVHRWRSEEDAILVGKNTALYDDPKLNVRDWTGRDPVRIVIDRHLSLSPALQLFDGSQKTICYNSVKTQTTPPTDFVRVGDETLITDILADLYSRNIQSVIIEGGAITINMFLKAGIWDEARVFTSPANFGDGIPAPKLHLKPSETAVVNGDSLDYFYNADQ